MAEVKDAVSPENAALTAVNPVLGGIKTGLDILGGLFGGGDDEEEFTPTQTQVTLPGASEMEQAIRNLSGGAATQAFSVAGGGGPQGLDLPTLVGGQLDPETMGRLRGQAFAGFDEAIQRARARSTGRASLSGLPGSSQESDFFTQAASPLISQRAQLFAGLQRQELQRRQQLRQQLLQNLLAVQQSPLLQQLLQERIAQPTTRTTEIKPEPTPLAEEPEVASALLNISR